MHHGVNLSQPDSLVGESVSKDGHHRLLSPPCGTRAASLTNGGVSFPSPWIWLASRTQHVAQ